MRKKPGKFLLGQLERIIFEQIVNLYSLVKCINEEIERPAQERCLSVYCLVNPIPLEKEWINMR